MRLQRKQRNKQIAVRPASHRSIQSICFTTQPSQSATCYHIWCVWCVIAFVFINVNKTKQEKSISSITRLGSPPYLPHPPFYIGLVYGYYLFSGVEFYCVAWCVDSSCSLSSTDNLIPFCFVIMKQ